MNSSWYTAPTAIWNEIYWHLLIRLNSVIRFHSVKGDQFRGLGAPFKTWSERYISSPRLHHQPALTPFLSHSTFSSLPALPGQGWITVRGFNYRQTSNIDCFTLELIKLYGFTVVQVYIQYTPASLTLYCPFHLQPHCWHCHLTPIWNVFILNPQINMITNWNFESVESFIISIKSTEYRSAFSKPVNL